VHWSSDGSDFLADIVFDLGKYRFQIGQLRLQEAFSGDDLLFDAIGVDVHRWLPVSDIKFDVAPSVSLLCYCHGRKSRFPDKETNATPH
jgi:hypothetical protein